MIKRLPPLLLGLLFSSAFLAGQSSVWKVTRDGATLYLGGTCHVLRPADFPLPAEFDRAFEASETLVFETDLARLQSPEMQQIVLQRGTYLDGRTLEQVLSPEAWRTVQAYCASNGVPLGAIIRLKPWLFTVMLSVMEFQKAGITETGVDQHYFERARAAAKPVTGLETFERHLDYITSLGDGAESDLVLRTLDDLKELPAMLEGILSAWRSGEVEAIEAAMLAEMRNDYPAIYEELIVRRNREWMPRIEEMLGTPSVEFVLVGVGHMAGPDGLLDQLRAKGCAIEQLRP